MNIPVYVQEPCKYNQRRFVGNASDDLPAEEVAKEMGVPDGCFLEGKVMRRKGEKHWSIVANVKFRERA